MKLPIAKRPPERERETFRKALRAMSRNGDRVVPVLQLMNWIAQSPYAPKAPLTLAIVLLLVPLAFAQTITPIMVPEGSQVVLVRVSTNAVTNTIAITPKAPTISSLGKQTPYVGTVLAYQTQTVTTVYEVKFLRVIDMTTNGLETNFATLRTNVLSVTQTNTPLRPE